MARPKTTRRRKALLAAAQRAIRQRHGEFDLALSDIAEEMGCSPRQLQRVFNELAGEDFRSYLLRVRMERAARMLMRGESTRAIAPRVGYRGPSGFRQAFVRFYGYNLSAIQPEPPEYPADVFDEQ